ncbi:M1 family metallopeptidase [Nocardioides solisilvae]|uniref:M1 family metallopeptidase n=1 Tax=Nocardioides solisilvae TaxID=1542435 RepID=UPI000D74CF25|nr:M1 family metallopeptidase [Nocardioides solisilvae]
MTRPPSPRTPRPLAAALATLALVVALGPSAAAHPGVRHTGLADPGPGSAGVGDPYFPLDGNGGIDVQHYDVRVGYDFEQGRLRGRTTLTLVPTQELSSFHLDLVLAASEVTVDGVPAAHRRTEGHELVVRPAAALQPGIPVEVEVTYAGRPGRERYRGASSWLADRHEVVTMNQPHMAPWWFPANDHPTDKATFDVSVRVPRGRQVVANGDLVSRRTRGATATWHWRAVEPMTTYLAFFAAGRFDVERGVSDGLPWTVAVSSRLPRAERRASMRMLRRTPAILRRLERDLGDYPFTSTGGVVTSLDPGFALENQTRPTYPVLTRGQEWLLVHELAHQWFGDSVAIARWRDIWLNEGAATFMEQRHEELRGVRTAADWLTRTHAGAPDSFWRLAIADPGPRRVFDDAVYVRGGMAFQALRNRIGEEAFWTLLRTWLETRRGGYATSEEFEALAAETSGQDLTDFFRVWLREPTRPAATQENGLI